jgi:ubiquinone biosynthesis protein COQ4
MTPSESRRRIRPWVALRAYLKVMRDPEDTASGARFVLAVDGDRGERNFQRFARDPGGARVLATRTSLTARLCDRDALRRLPAGSLGRAYLGFVEAEGISAEGLAAAVEPVELELGELDAERKLFAERVRAMHDLWHVLTGYSRDLLGEMQLLAFSHVQLRTRAFGWLVRLLPLTVERKAPGTRRLIALARSRAQAAPWLPAEDWESLLELPLDEVRERLRVGAPPAYTQYVRAPNGWGLVPRQPERIPRLSA